MHWHQAQILSVRHEEYRKYQEPNTENGAYRLSVVDNQLVFQDLDFPVPGLYGQVIVLQFIQQLMRQPR